MAPLNEFFPLVPANGPRVRTPDDRLRPGTQSQGHWIPAFAGMSGLRMLHCFGARTRAPA